MDNGLRAAGATQNQIFFHFKSRLSGQDREVVFCAKFEKIQVETVARIILKENLVQAQEKLFNSGDRKIVNQEKIRATK